MFQFSSFRKQASKLLIINILVRTDPYKHQWADIFSVLNTSFTSEDKAEQLLTVSPQYFCHAPTNLFFLNLTVKISLLLYLFCQKFAHHSLSYTHFIQLGHEPKESSYKVAHININRKITVSTVSTINYNGKNIPGTALVPSLSNTTVLPSGCFSVTNIMITAHSLQWKHWYTARGAWTRINPWSQLQDLKRCVTETSLFRPQVPSEK